MALQQGVLSGQSTSLSAGRAKQPCTTLDLLCIHLLLQQRTDSINENRDEIVVVRVTYVVCCILFHLTYVCPLYLWVETCKANGQASARAI